MFQRMTNYLLFILLSFSFSQFANAQFGIIWQQPDSSDNFLGASNMDNDVQDELVYYRDGGLNAYNIRIRDGLTGVIEWNSGNWYSIQIAGYNKTSGSLAGHNSGFSPFCDYNGDGKKEITFLGTRVMGDPKKAFVVGLGGTGIDGTGDINPIPIQHTLSQNYPNPFNPNTTIEYQITAQARTRLIIYNILGQIIRTLVDEEKKPGDYSIVWDGKNNEGQLSATGTYFYQLQAGDYISSKKLLLLK